MQVELYRRRREEALEAKREQFKKISNQQEEVKRKTLEEQQRRQRVLDDLRREQEAKLNTYWSMPYLLISKSFINTIISYNRTLFRLSGNFIAYAQLEKLWRSFIFYSHFFWSQNLYKRIKS